MARKRKAKSGDEVEDCRHDDARRTNNPPARMGPTYEVRERKAHAYEYEPRDDSDIQRRAAADRPRRRLSLGVSCRTDSIV